MEKLLVMSNLSFSHSVFKRLVSQGRQKVSLCWNGLTTDKILQSFKLEAAVDDTTNEVKLMILVEWMVEQGENTDYQNFLLFPHNIFKRLLTKGC